MRYLIMSDIHANAAGLDAVLTTAPTDLPIWFLGDAVGYYPDVSEVLDRLIGLGDRLQVWMRGNHDQAAISDRPKAFDMNGIALAAIQRTHAQLSPVERNLLATRPIGPLAAPHEPTITLVHGGTDDPLNHYLHDTHNAARAAQTCPTRLCLVGHTHIPLKLYSPTPEVPHSWRRQALFHTKDNTYRYDEAMVFLNPGSIGQPRDGFRDPHDHDRPHATYAILDTNERTFQVHRVAYDLGDLPARTRSWLGGHLPDHLIEPHILRLTRGV